MFEFALKNPIVLSVAMLIICLFGLVAVFRVPVQMIPDIDARVITVETRWPGATPQDVEKEILIEQEDYLRNIPGLERMISQATTGRAEVELEFPHGTDLNEALIRVNNALTQVPGYPENVDEPRLITKSLSDNPFMFYRVMPVDGNPMNVDIVRMRDYIDDHVRTQLERVPGVSEVEMYGGAERQIKILVDPAKLAERQISIPELRAAIRSRNRDVSGGDLDSGKRRYLIRTIGRFESVEDINDMVIARRGNSSVRLRDVGHAELDHFEVRIVSLANGRPNISLGIRRQVGTNVIAVMDGVVARAKQLNAGPLARAGMEMNLTAEDVRYVKDAVGVVRQNLIIGAVLATLVLYLFLRSWPATLVGAIGLPVCTISAFLGLLMMGRTINVISLAGIAFAIGMTLDNSIVVLENIYRHLGMGKTRTQAALDGVREVWSAVLASTLTTVFVFIPIVFVKQETGQLYSDIAIAIAASILTSMLVAVSIIPVACNRFLTVRGPESGPPSGFYQFGQRVGNAIMRFVTWLTLGVTRRLVLIGAVFVITSAIILGLTPKAEYLPEGEEQKIFAFMFAPPGYNIDQMTAAMHQIKDKFVTHVGQDPQLYADGESDIPGLNSMVQYARTGMVITIVEATDRAHAAPLVKILSEQLTEIPGVIPFVSRGSIFASNLGGARSINVDISGPSLAPLFEVGFKAFLKSKEIFEDPQVRPQPSSLVMGQPMLEVHPDWERAAELGFETDQLGYIVWAFSDGAFVDEFFLADDKIDMFLYSTGGTIQRPDDLEHLLIHSPRGGIIPLSAVAQIRETVNTETIRRVDGERTITLSITPPRSVALEEGIETVERDLIDAMQRSGDVAEGITMHVSGASDRLKSTRQALGGNFAIAVITAYLLMVAILAHWGYPLVIMATVPIGISGGIVGLWVLNVIGANIDLIGLVPFQQPFDMITMLGFLVLIGTVVNNPILIMEQTLKNVTDHGMESASAVIEATRSRLRPIVMSTITTVCGLSPLVLLGGAGTELYRGLGAIVLFGLLFSAVITLTLMPTVLSLILELRNHLVNRTGAELTGTGP